MANRVLNGRALRHIPALMDLALDRHPAIVVQKSAQVGISEFLVNVALHGADTRYADRGNVLFVMPTENQMSDFTQGRIDSAIEQSDYLRRRLQPEPPRRKAADNRRLKRFVNAGCLYLRGAESKRQMATVDADIVILDEFDQMQEGIIELARKRLTSSARGRLIVASTPRLPEAGINAMFLQSDQRRYFLTCTNCGLEQYLRFPDNIDFTRAIIACRQCGTAIDVRRSGRWIAQAPGNDRIHGYHLGRLYSPWLNVPELIAASEGATVFEREQFANSDLGEPFVPPGGGISVDVLDRCRTDYVLQDYAGQPCDMGVDVGTSLHVIIRERLRRGGDCSDFRPKLWFADEVQWEDLDGLISKFNVRSFVIDGLPEVYGAAQLVLRHRGVGWLAVYRLGGGDERTKGRYDQPGKFAIDRLAALDAMFQRFRDGLVELPRDARELGGRVRDGYGEYYREMLAPRRTIERDAHNNLVPRWVDDGRADHYAHAELYAMKAAEDYGARVGHILTFR